ncbi:MAG TPA: hypothetical protein VF053_07235 [Streptosporangiales bacterium]
MNAAPMAAPAGLDPRAIRPRRYWYLVAGAVALVALLVPLAGYVVGQLTAPKLTEIGTGVTTLTMKTSETRWLYVSKPKRLVPPPCRMGGPGDVHLDVLSRFSSVDQGGTRWYAIAKVRVTADGTYSLVCIGPPGGVRLAVGGDPASGNAFGLVADVLVPVLGVPVALVLALLTFVRRRSHRAGMLAAASAPGGAWGPPGYGAPPGYPAPAQPPPYDYPPPYQSPPGPGYPPRPGPQPPWRPPPQGR